MSNRRTVIEQTIRDYPELTLTAIAKRLGVSLAYVSAINRGVGPASELLRPVRRGRPRKTAVSA